VQREKITMVQFPGIYVLLRKQANSGGTAGSSVNHFGLSVREFDGERREVESRRSDMGARTAVA